MITYHLWYAVCYINVTYKTQASKGVKPIATHTARDLRQANTHCHRDPLSTGPHSQQSAHRPGRRNRSGDLDSAASPSPIPLSPNPRDRASAGSTATAEGIGPAERTLRVSAAMALSDLSRESLLPSFLYAPAAARSFAGASRLPASPAAAPGGAGAPSFPIQAPKEKIEMYSPAFYAACTAGGIASCGLTHMAVTPLDLVKCNMQVSVSGGFVLLVGSVCSLVIWMLFRFGSDVWGLVQILIVYHLRGIKNR